MTSQTQKGGADIHGVLIAIICSLGALWALFAAANPGDAAMAGHSWLILGGFLFGLILLAGAYASGHYRNDESQYNENVIKAATIAALFWGVAGFLVGVIIAAQLGSALIEATR
jgi:cytochrome c oxidase cbb3-type subunit 1